MQRRLSELKDAARLRVMQDLLGASVAKATDALGHSHVMSEVAADLDHKLTAANETIEQLKVQLTEAHHKLVQRTPMAQNQ